ncbi:MAG: DUF2628 domain-containing protein [Flavobacteriales bacterium]|nr:DUF2628 domain-containing protein [Flavobacteriales bacterium]
MESESIHPGPWGEFPDRYWRAYFGADADYFMHELGKLREGRGLEFRFVAFFLGLFWMLYRKMYAVGTCYFLLVMLEGSLEGAVEMLFGIPTALVEGFGSLVSIGLSVALGIYGNRLYLWDARRNIRQVMVESPGAHDQALEARIAMRGGTSHGAVALAIVILIAFVVVGTRLMQMGDGYL